MTWWELTLCDLLVFVFSRLACLCVLLLSFFDDVTNVDGFIDLICFVWAYDHLFMFACFTSFIVILNRSFLLLIMTNVSFIAIIAYLFMLCFIMLMHVNIVKELRRNKATCNSSFLLEFTFVHMSIFTHSIMIFLNLICIYTCFIFFIFLFFCNFSYCCSI